MDFFAICHALFNPSVFLLYCNVHVDLSKEINTMSEEYMANVRSMDAANRTMHLKKIENAFVKSREYGDDKVQLAMQTYEMVGKYGL